jgi:hypothetical protein
VQTRVLTLQQGSAPCDLYHDGTIRHVTTRHAPAWILVFAHATDVTDAMTLDQARAVAVYAWRLTVEYDSWKREINVPLPTGIQGELVRLQLEGEGQVIHYITTKKQTNIKLHVCEYCV